MPATQASSDPSQTARTPMTTTKKPATQATPSPEDCDRLGVASRDGDLEEVKRLLSQGVDINCRGLGSWTPVMRAAWYGHRDVVELLVSKGADVSLVDEDGDNILHLACMRGHLETVKYVLSLHVVDINSRGQGSRTPVMRAAAGGHIDVVELLASKGADVSMVDKDSDNILHYACMRGHLETVKFVLSLNVVDINSRGQGRTTPVMRAAAGGHRDVVELLMSKGADVSLVDKDGDNILHLACMRGHLETVRFVLSQNVVDINSKGLRSTTPAMRAAVGGHRDVVELLVSKGADVSVVDGVGNNILHLACMRGHLETVKFVLSLNVVDINSRGLRSTTPVMGAAGLGHRDVVELLASKGADVSLVDEDGDNILHLACMKGHLETVKFVLSLNVVDINSRGQFTTTPVMRAAAGGHRDVVELLVSKGADVSLVDGVGNNILHMACLRGDMETVEYVLSLDVVDINSRGMRSMTPVIAAAVRGHSDVVELLVSKGADVSLVDKDGDSTLHMACLRGDTETIEFMLSLNVVDIDARNKLGLTAADLARLRSLQPVVDLLVSHGAQ
ncbi:ankyrin repeat domain-containing protein 50-like isoform X1 [Haliotis cracherodii]|uniref:ankyrin repeat domain-containing protein 50-like isoform X1 n=1 Tax=Haliotis cracherodii TaxID=6455 RepID=UPI0039E8B3A6